jgi:methionine synthase II (cobalamin-independent)
MASLISIPTEPIGSIPRPSDLVAAWAERHAGRLSVERFNEIADNALRDTIRRFEETGSPVITDGEQTKSSFATYALDGMSGLSPDGVVVPFADGHTRQLPRLTTGPFRYATHASTYVAKAKQLTGLSVKQAVISASALSLLYPEPGIPGYPREAFLTDLVNEAVADIRLCLDQGAHNVQIDFTEGRLSLKLDPTGALLEQFIALNNRVLDHFSDQDRQRIGVHTCPGGDRDSTHSADVDYAGLLPALFGLDSPDQVRDPHRSNRASDDRACRRSASTGSPSTFFPRPVSTKHVGAHRLADPTRHRWAHRSHHRTQPAHPAGDHSLVSTLRLVRQTLNVRFD